MLQRISALTIGLGLLLVIGGCHSPGGGWMPYTGGSTTYQSTEIRPASVTLVDTRTDEVVFSMDVPAGKELTVQFFDGEGDDSVYTPDLMRYYVFDLGTRTGKLQNAMSVPPAMARRLDVNYRSWPEYRQPSPEEQYRVDQVNERPAWWTSKGGPYPERDTALTNYDH